MQSESANSSPEVVHVFGFLLSILLLNNNWSNSMDLMAAKCPVETYSVSIIFFKIWIPSSRFLSMLNPEAHLTLALNVKSEN